MSGSLTAFSTYIIPSAVVLILVYGAVKRVPVFDTFLVGAKEGLRSSVSILPSLVGLLMAVTMLKASGALDLFTQLISPIASAIGFPPEVTPLTLLRPISGSGSTAILTQIYESYGPDSFIGRVASVMAGSTETTFYAIAVYYGAVGIKKLRHTIPAALTADLACAVFAVLTTNLFFGKGA